MELLALLKLVRYTVRDIRIRRNLEDYINIIIFNRNVGVVAYSSIEAYESINPSGNYLFGFSLRLGGYLFYFYFIYYIYFSLYFKVLVNRY